MKSTDILGGFVKGLTVIEAFGETSDRLSITQVAAATGMDRATSRRCLLTLVDRGYASFDGKYFSLTPKILRLGHSYLTSARLPTIMQPALERLMAETGQPASAGVLDDQSVVHIARAAERKVMSINLSPGSRVPAYCSAMGRVLLSELPESDAKDLVSRMDRQRLTEHTLTGVDEIMEQVRLTGARGYGAVDRELDSGLCALAVPVRNSRGNAVAALNIGALFYVKSLDEMIEQHLDLLLQTSHSLRDLMPL